MQNSRIELKNIIIFVTIILFFSIIYMVIDKIIDNQNDAPIYMKNYEVNEYIPVYVSNEDMAKIYLNDYIHTMYSDINKAYNLLDEEEKAKIPQDNVGLPCECLKIPCQIKNNLFTFVR